MTPAGRILGAGFEDDPVMAWAFADPGRRDKLTALFSSLDERHGAAVDASESAAAIWLPPDPPPPGDEQELANRLLAAGATIEDLSRLGELGEAMDAAHPPEPHWYLAAIATLPDRRAEGLGGRLLARTLERVDAEHLPAYLESSNPRNVTLYERHGFVATGVVQARSAPPMTAMWRDAR